MEKASTVYSDLDAHNPAICIVGFLLETLLAARISGKAGGIGMAGQATSRALP